MSSEVLRQPAEWAPHDAVWPAWPSHEDLWGAALPDVRRSFTAFARAIARAHASRQAFEALPPDPSARAHVIAGTGEDTPASARADA